MGWFNFGRKRASSQLADKAVAMCFVQMGPVFKKIGAKVPSFDLQNRFLALTLGYIGGVIDAIHQAESQGARKAYDEQTVNLALLIAADALLGECVPELSEQAAKTMEGVKAGIGCGWFNLQAISESFAAGQTRGGQDMHEFWRTRERPRSLEEVFERL